MLVNSKSDITVYRASHKNCIGEFKVNSLKMLSFYVSSIYTYAKMNFLVIS